MITCNFKIKIISNKNNYNENYALKYLERRIKTYTVDKENFQNLFKKYNINISNETVLDLASGVGMDLKILSEFKPKTLIWHDKMEGVYKIAKNNLKDIKNITFNIKDLLELDGYSTNTIKFIICRESLYYINNDFYFFKEIKRILKPNGFFWGRNVNINWYKQKSPEIQTIKKIRGLYFDWPLYKLTGLRFFAFTPVDSKRLKYIFKKLNFLIEYFKEEENYLEFLIKK